ncbi:hypothetical protein [Brochothrix phage ADU4]|nr:hypothetical protein [Brochothrix phage ADU4]
MVLNIDSSIEDIKNWVTEEDVLKVMIAMELITEEDLTKEDIDSIGETDNSINKTLSDSSKK